MAHANLVDLGRRPQSKSEIYQEEKKFVKTKKLEFNFDNILPRVRQKNMGMNNGFKDGMFGECQL